MSAKSGLVAGRRLAGISERNPEADECKTASEIAENAVF